MNEILNDFRVLGLDIYRNLFKYPLQRLLRGYCDEDLWGLDVYMAKRILPALEAFRKKKICGHPSDFKGNKEWLEAIDQMIYGLKFVLKDDSMFNSTKKDYDKARAGLELFGKYFRNLWD